MCCFYLSCLISATGVLRSGLAARLVIAVVIGSLLAEGHAPLSGGVAFGLYGQSISTGIRLCTSTPRSNRRSIRSVKDRTPQARQSNTRGANACTGFSSGRPQASQIGTASSAMSERYRVRIRSDVKSYPLLRLRDVDLGGYQGCHLRVVDPDLGVGQGIEDGSDELVEIA